MQKLKFGILVIVSSFIFTLLFYHENFGLNLLLFEVFLITALLIIKKVKLTGRLELITFSGTIATAVLVVIYNSDLSITVNLISIFLFSGTIVFPKLRNLSYAPFLAAGNIFSSQISSLKMMFEGNIMAQKIIKYIKIVAIPLIVFCLFLLMYKLSNPVLEEYTDSIAIGLDKWITIIFSEINIPLVFTFILGIVISNYFFFSTAGRKIVSLDENGNDNLVRKRKERIFNFRIRGLLNEYKTGVFLFVILNLLLLIVNLIDIYWVWFNFEWNGQFLKQFIHEGTYLLIFSVLLSIGLTLYYFRGNLNFLKNNIWLVRLSKLWLLQNAILIVSVAIRNFWYIHYYALAYKRIGVIFFLIACIVCLYFVFRKIGLKKSPYYLFRKNSLSLYIILVSMAFFNWDIIIAKYNFGHYETSFVHLNFLYGLSDKALPYLDIPEEKLKRISAGQKEQFSSDRSYYMKPEDYYENIQKRKESFVNEWPSKGFLSWNLADQRAYRMLMKE